MELFQQQQPEIEKFVGKGTKIKIADWRNPNTASLLFCKSSFAKIIARKKQNQTSNAKGCETSEEIGLP